jgi:glycosyltransferase involved in cell wall biosynthesis
MEKIALYIDNRFSGTGGSQYSKSILDALVALAPDRYTLTVIYTIRDWENYLSRFSTISLCYFNRSTSLLKLYQVLFSIGLISVAKRIAGRLDKKVVFINSQSFDLVIFPSADTIACLVDVKTLGTIHDLMHRYERRFKEAGSLLRYYYRENYYKNLLIHANSVLVDSSLGRKHVIDSYSNISSKIFILPYIAPYNYYSQQIPEQIPKDVYKTRNKYLFYPAALCPHKNHLNLFKAIKILKEKGIKIDLLLAGRKKLEYKRLKRIVHEYNLEEQIQFLGYVPDEEIVYYFKNAFALVMPTFFGPTNIPPIEAVLMDCIPILSNNYAMPEQFDDAALYFNPYEPASIADAIESIVNDNELRKRLLSNGNHIKHKFSQERFESDLKKTMQCIDGQMYE